MSKIIFNPIMSNSIISVLLGIMIVIILINKKHIVNRLLIVILVFIINQRPMIKSQDDSAYALNLDVIFVVDTTVSMNATDVQETRMAAVKEICKEIVNEFPGSNYSLITYDNVAHMNYPFTNDTAAFLGVIDDLLIINPFYSVGSALTVPIEFLKMALESAGENKQYDNAKRQNIVFILGDGELNNEEKLKTNFNEYDKIVGLIDNGAVIGIGTKEGGKIKITYREIASDYQDREVDNYTKRYLLREITNEEGYLINKNTGQPAISKLDEKNLSELASKLKIDYIKNNGSKLKRKIKEIKNSAIINQNETAKKNKDIYYYFSAVLLVLLLYELFYYKQRLVFYRRKEL